MAHQIESNYAFFASSTPAWHGIGTVLRDAPSTEQAWKLAYPFEVFQLPVSARVTDDSGQEYHTDCPEHNAIVRSDGKVLSVMSNRYGVVQPYKMFSVFSPLIDSGLVTLEAGGSLKEGKKLWALGKIVGADQEILPGDTIKAYVLFHTSYDGSERLSGGLTGVRVVCANTLAQAQSAGLAFSTKHTKNVNERLDNAVANLEGMIKAWRSNCDIMRDLAERKVDHADQCEYITKVIGGDDIIKKPHADMATKTVNKIRHVIDLLDTQRGMELVPAMRGTAWQAYNAVSEYITHESGRTQENRLDSQYFGSGAALNLRALELARAL